MFNLDAMTFGAELEYADVRYGQRLPDGCCWNKMDHTIVNSNGIANDPLGRLWVYGGEINTRPTGTAEEQAELFAEINEMLDPPPVINYRDNLHIHVRVPGLKDDLDACKKLLRYIVKHADSIYALVDPIPKPSTDDYPDSEAYAGAMKRYHRRKVSHQHRLPPGRVAEMLTASSSSQFYKMHGPLCKNGRRLMLSTRAGINIRQMWQGTETIEFRHFPGTIDKEEFHSCCKWCEMFLHAALVTEQTPEELLAERPLKFPKFKPYDHDLEMIYRKTSFADNKRNEVRDTLRVMVMANPELRKLAPLTLWE